MPRRPGTLARLWRDRRGAVLIYVTLTVGVMFGLGGLAIDGARLYGVHTEMQSFADHVALAAAGELDGNSDAIARAIQAANTLVADTQTFATPGPGPLGLEEIRFFESIPGDDQAERCGRIPEGWAGEFDPGAADSNARAAFVEVTVAEEEVGLSLLRGLTVLTGNDLDDPTTCTSATAGFTQYACDITPLMICNPYEPETNADPFFPFEVIRGQQIQVKLRGPGWAPGAFGLLDAPFNPSHPCPDNPGARSFSCAVAAVGGVTRCFAQRGVDIQTGDLGEVSEAAFNVRFDMWGPQTTSRMDDDRFAPALNVTSGLVRRGNSCTQFDPTSDIAPLPRDSCFESGTCERLGNGVSVAQLEEYWRTNHDGVDLPGSLRSLSSLARYDVYMHELDTTQIPQSTPSGPPPCAPAPELDPDRRTLVMAVINCRAHGVAGNSVRNIPVLKFIKVFMTEPADSGDLWVETLEELEPGGDDGFLHEYIVLYR
jgi:hypothetical protein